jgi:hypothetical protein
MLLAIVTIVLLLIRPFNVWIVRAELVEAHIAYRQA